MKKTCDDAVFETCSYLSTIQNVPPVQCRQDILWFDKTESRIKAIAVVESTVWYQNCIS